MLLAALLIFGSEVLVWTNPTQRPLTEWLFLVPGYLGLSLILIDLIFRYRINDLFGILLLAGIYSLTAALVLNPAATLNDLPRTLFTRVMGAHALLAAEMIGLLLALTAAGRHRRKLLTGSLIIGLAWGIWVKQWPPAEGYGQISLSAMLGVGLIGLVLIALLLYGILPRWPRSGVQSSEAPDHLRLPPRLWASAIILMVLLLLLRLARMEINSTGFILCLLLLSLCWVIIWFRARKQGETLLDRVMPFQALPLPAFVTAALIFIGMGMIGYNLPNLQIGSVSPFTLVGLGFTAYGLAWLPTVSFVLGVQGYLRQLAARKL